MNFKAQKIEKRIKRAICSKYALFSLFVILSAFKISPQDSIPATKDLSEEKELQFQEYFFKALAEKSITNYQKAIENLEECNQILPNNIAVFFEFSKNYLLLNKTLLANEYIQRAILQAPNNIWMLQHLVAIHKKNQNFKEAIKIQEQIIALDANKKSNLVFLYLQDNAYEKARILLAEIQQEKGLTANLKRIKASLESVKPKRDLNSKTVQSLTSLIKEFESSKSFEILQQIFEELEKENNIIELIKFSEKGIALYPAQPLVYLVNGKVLNTQRKFKEALASLLNGIDFVITDDMEMKFYKQMAIASAGLGNKNDAKKYNERVRKLKS